MAKVRDCLDIGEKQHVIFKPYKTIFITAGKCASGSMKRTVYSKLNIQSQSRRDELKITTKQIADRYINKQWLRIAIWRDPVDRLASCWRDKMERKFFKGFEFVSGLNPGMSFNDFARVVSETPDEISDGHFRSQSCFYTYGEVFLPNVFIDFDKLPNDWQLAQDASVKFCGLKLPDLKPSRRRTNNKKHLTVDELDGEVLALVKKRYANDYDLKRFLNSKHD